MDGDILVLPGGDGRGEYMLQEWPLAPQVTVRSREAALDLAARFARTQAVNVWLTDGSSPVLMSRHRSG